MAWDHGPDTAALLNGLGIYAIISEQRRRYFLKLRRASIAVWLTGLVILAALPALWLGGAFEALVGSEIAIVSGSEVLLLVVPALAVAVGLVVCAYPEFRFRRAFGQRWDPRAPWRRSDIRSDVVRGWLGASGDTGLPRLKALTSATTGVLLTLGAVALITVTAVVLATAVVVMGQVATNRAAASVLDERLAAGTSDAYAWQETDALLRAFAVLANPGAAADPEAAALLAGMALPGLVGDPIWNADMRLRNALTDQPAIDPETLHRAWRRLPQRLPDSVRALLSEVASSPPVAVFRRVAWSDKFPVLWYLRPEFPERADPENLPALSGERVVTVAQANIAAALLAMEAGDRDEASLHVRATVAVGHELLRQPDRRAFRTGWSIVWWGLDGARQIARITHDSGLAGRVEKLQAAMEDLWPTMAGMHLLVADPNDRRVLEYAADTTLLPAVRWELAKAVGTGFCGNTREVLFGPSPKRHAMLADAGRRMGDMERIDEFITLNRRRLELLRTDPSAILRSMGLRTAGPSSVHWWVGRAEVRDRLQFCALISFLLERWDAAVEGGRLERSM